MSEGVLAGRRIGILEARLASETAALVRRLGGIPVSAPALREEPLPAGPAVAALLDALAAGTLGWVVLLTGVAVTALFKEAEALGRAGELLDGLARARTVSRGPKPAAALASRGLQPAFSVPAPYTTRNLLALLETLPVQGKGVAVVHYGERNETLTAALRALGARVEELVLYEWRLPEDTAPLERLAELILAGALDAVAFTTQAQVRHLFSVVEPGRRAALAEALDRRVVTAAVGPTCAEALRARGVREPVVPANPKLRPLFAALASRLAEPSAVGRKKYEV